MHIDLTQKGWQKSAFYFFIRILILITFLSFVEKKLVLKWKEGKNGRTNIEKRALDSTNHGLSK